MVRVPTCISDFPNEIVVIDDGIFRRGVVTS